MRQKSQNILLTGASGQLGRFLTNSKIFSNLLTPSRKTFNIWDSSSIKKYFKSHSFSTVIHTAAIARMRQAYQKPVAAIDTNIIGTCLLVKEILQAEKRTKKSIRFIYISTDGVYPSTNGHYQETSPTIPYNHYGWTKLGGECAVRLLKNFCIIRTRFFNPHDLPFKTYPRDSYNSNISLNELAQAIKILLSSDFIGAVNIGGPRMSDFQRFKKFKTTIKPCRLKDLQEQTPFILSRDASLNCGLWKKILKKSSHGI
jgi:dTDP-4-dehydrorhamnose reductase